MLARRFLWVITGIIVLLLIGAIGYRLFGNQLIRYTYVPSAPFEAAPAPALDYAKADNWIARPDIPDNPSSWMPKPPEPGEGGVEENALDPGNVMALPAEPVTPEQPRAGARRASIFFIHPTSYLDKSRWNAEVDHPESQQRARLFVRSQSSVFNHVGDVWAPKYRQATFGAFLTTQADAEKAFDFAYRDVLAAFDRFVAQAPKNRPIILAGHSQGSLHLTRLMLDRVAGKPIANRIAAVYAIGWPISRTADLDRMGLPACETAGQPGCILSWQSFGEPANPGLITDVYDTTTGFNGSPRAGSPMVCTNPLTGNANDAAPASANRGTTVPNAELTEATLVPGGASARCDVRGFLLIGEDAPDLGPYVLPGNNYHVYDYALFWMNMRRDVEARLDAYLDR